MLSPHEALIAAIEKAGGQSGLARICGCTQGAVWQMLNKDDAQLSHKFVLKVEEATGVSRHDLRPDIYPREIAA